MIIITGASRGIGKYLFKKYSLNNEDLYGTYNTTYPTGINNTSRLSRVNILNFNEVQKWVDSMYSKNNITLINCAAVFYNSFAHKSDIEKWAEVINTNITGTFNVIRTLLPIMREDNFGRIINFSSIVAQKGTPGVSAYAASKSALWGLSKSIAVENGAKGITINNINLGYSELGMINDVPEKFKNQIKAQIPSGEFCSKDDIYKCVESIRQLSYLNGSSVNLDGGIY